MNILIIGGAGFLGANLTRRCILEKNANITVFDSLDERLGSTLDSLKGVLTNIKFIKGDIRNQASIDNAVKDQDIIFNCAAQTSHPLSLKDPFFDVDVNCLGNLRILEAVRCNNKDALLIYVSSSTVIGKAVGDVIEESHWERPLDIYSANKGVAEKYYRIYHTVYDLRTIIIRFANLYGPYGKGNSDFGFINFFINEAWNGRDITIYRPGTQTRNVLYVEDAADLLVNASKEEKLIGNMYFAVHDEHMSVREIAYGIVECFNRSRVVEIDWPEIRRRIEVDNMIISSAKLRSQLKWKPRFNFEEGLLRTKKILTGNNNL
jgi:UDP-glucose 4-epimerase